MPHAPRIQTPEKRITSQTPGCSHIFSYALFARERYTLSRLKRTDGDYQKSWAPNSLQMDKVGKSQLFSLKTKNSLRKSRERIRSAGQAAGHGAVKGCVNCSFPLHFCHASQSLSPGPLPLSSDVVEAGKLDPSHRATNKSIPCVDLQCNKNTDE